MTTLAYLDAGSGSMLLQALLGGLAGLAVMGRLLGAKVRHVLFFWRKPSAEDLAARPDAVESVEAPKSPRT